MKRKHNVKPKPFKRKDGSVGWRVRFRLEPGTNPVSETFDHAEDAETFAQMVNTVGGLAARKARDMSESGGTKTLNAAFESYAVQAATGAQPDTILKYRRIWERHIAPIFGAWPVTALSREAVAEWIVTLRDTETEVSARRTAKDPTAVPDFLSAKTIANTHGLLSAVLNHEVINGGLASNPAFKMRLPAKQKKRTPVFLTQSAYAQLAAVVDPEWVDMVHLFAGSGARFSEVTALLPEDFTLDDGNPRVRIDKAWKRTGKGGWHVGPPKTEQSNRTVSLSPSVVRQIASRVEKAKPGTLVFQGPRGGRVTGDWFHDRIWKPAIVKAKLGRPPMIHDLRHSHASWLIAAGVPLPMIQRRLGHSSIQVTSDVYGHLAPDAFAVTAAATESAMVLALPEIADLPELEG